MTKDFMCPSKNLKASILVMTLIIASGIMIVGAEFSLFVISAIRQARTIDQSVIASYAAESGIESGLFQIRQEGRTTLRKSASSQAKPKDDTTLEEFPAGMTWTLENVAGPPIVTRFNNAVQILEKSVLKKNESVQLALYETTQTGLEKVSDLASVKIAWSAYACAADAPIDQRPWYEISVIQWNGGGVDWSSAEVKKDFLEVGDLTPGVPAHEVVYSFGLKPGETVQNPMLVRIKPLFCDIIGMEVTLHSDVGGTSVPSLKIPNYFLLVPEGSYQTISQRGRVIFPAKSSASGVFDFVLFSEEKVQKKSQ